MQKKVGGKQLHWTDFSETKIEDQCKLFWGRSAWQFAPTRSAHPPPTNSKSVQKILKVSKDASSLMSQESTAFKNLKQRNHFLLKQMMPNAPQQNWGPPRPQIGDSTSMIFKIQLCEWIIQSPELSTIPYLSTSAASPPHLAFRNQYEVGTPHGKSWHTACAERHAAMPNAHLMSRLDKPFQCWEPMSQLELKLLPVLLPAQKALKLLWKPAVNQIWKTILGYPWNSLVRIQTYKEIYHLIFGKIN